MEEVTQELPENIIQHIQSYLGTREAARTSLLSKPWYASWLTRPSLDFDQAHFTGLRHGLFEESVTTILQRYQQCNLKLHRFGLSLHSGSLSTDEFIIQALKLGVTDLSLSIEGSLYVIPVQVFAAFSLSKLSLVRCKIDHIFLPQVKCPHIVSLSLHSVSIDDEAMKVILTGCSIIEEIYLVGCKGLSEINVTKMRYRLKKLHVDHFNTSIEPFYVVFHDSSRMINLPVFRKLTSLVFRNVSVGDAFFDQFMLKFPCLEHLMLDAPSDPIEQLHIESSTLKFLGLRYCWRLKNAKLDVPNIRKFEFVGVRSNIPSLSISNDSKNWESHITFISYHFEAIELREFLKMLSCSRIFLSVQHCSAGSGMHGEHAQDSNIPVVEDLMIRGLRLPLSSVYLSSLLWNCHPEFISQEFDSFRDLGCLYETLKHQVNRVLVDFRIDFFEEMKWHPMRWEAVLDAWNCDNGRQIRFRLQWSID